MADQSHQIYHSFLVRCWLMPGKTTDEPALWRFEVREVPAGDHNHRFGDIEGLKKFMASELAAIATGGNRDNNSEEERRGG
ncbi:MAG: hypothetical protein R3293_27795 [Candidatus Promineifilaceae bacterium]|nr:hypothetical protein [Candidatus Promineifilaceae bacterium]